MRARGVTTPLLIATASSSIDLNTVSSPGESSIRYMPDLMGAGFRAKEVLRSAISRNFRARVRCTFLHAELTDAAHCNRCVCGWRAIEPSTTWRTTDGLLLCSFLQLASAAENSGG